MKTKNIIIGLNIALIFISCEKIKYDGIIEAPNISINVQNPIANVLDTVFIKVNSDAQYLSYYQGDTLHKFEYSRTYALWKQGIDAFYDETFKIPVTDKVTEKEWKFYENSSIEQIKAEGFSFYNCTAELGEFDQPSTAYMKVNNRKQLHLTIPSNSKTSCLALAPKDMYIGRDYQKKVSQKLYMELYFISDAADAALRESSGIVGQCKMKVTYVMKDGKRFFNKPGPQEVKNNININYRTKNPLLYPSGGGEFTTDVSSFKGILVDQIDSLIIQFGSGLGVVNKDTSKYYGFSGDVYIVSMKLGDTQYNLWDEGQDLYTDYNLEKKSEHEVKLVYKKAGTYDFWVVGTNVGRKIYTDENNFQNDYGFSSKDYNIKRTYEKVTITIN